MSALTHCHLQLRRFPSCFGFLRLFLPFHLVSYNTWYDLYCDEPMNEKIVKQTADLLISTGLFKVSRCEFSAFTIAVRCSWATITSIWTIVGPRVVFRMAQCTRRRRASPAACKGSLTTCTRAASCSDCELSLLTLCALTLRCCSYSKRFRWL